VAATREHPDLDLGASTRASLAWARLAQALALVQGTGFVRPEQLQALAVPVLAHRLVPAGALGSDRTRASGTVRTILDRVPVPR
jgi:MoxR-like ATPase